MKEQTVLLKNLFSKPKPKEMKIIAVASGKGGVGKSTTAVNLAYSLHKLGAEVGLLDADIYGPSLPLLLHKTKPIIHKEQKSSAEKIIPPSYGGVKMISIGHFHEQIKAAVMRGPMVNSLIKQLLTSVSWGNLDYLIIDYPPGTGDIQITLSQSANLWGALMVTTPQEVALSDVRKAIHMFKLTGVSLLGVVENMSSFICDSCDKVHHIFLEKGAEKIAEEFQTQVLAQIPLESTLSSASDDGVPLSLSHPDSKSSQEYLELAQKIIDQNKAQTTNLKNFTLRWQKA